MTHRSRAHRHPGRLFTTGEKEKNHPRTAFGMAFCSRSSTSVHRASMLRTWRRSHCSLPRRGICARVRATRDVLSCARPPSPLCHSRNAAPLSHCLARHDLTMVPPESLPLAPTAHASCCHITRCFASTWSGERASAASLLPHHHSSCVVAPLEADTAHSVAAPALAAPRSNGEAAPRIGDGQHFAAVTRGDLSRRHLHLSHRRRHMRSPPASQAVLALA